MLRDACKHYSNCATFEYFVEPIPKRKVNNARESLKIQHNEQFIALIDFTMFGSAKEAMVVTNDGLHWKNHDDKTPYSLTWEQLRGRTLRETTTSVLSKYIELGGELRINLSGASSLVKRENHSVLLLLTDLKTIAAGDIPDWLINRPKHIEHRNDDLLLDSPTRVNLDQLDSGFIECEFCQNKIKPDVTYCKHCGIKLQG